MRNFMDMTQNERRQHMHQCLDNTFCALMLYYGQDNEIHTCAMTEKGYEFDILSLYHVAASKVTCMVEENIDRIQEGGDQ